MNFFRYYREGSHCEKCDRSCERCTGPGPESCRACSPPLLELQGTKLCVESCPHRFYQLDDICKQCHTSCQTCTGTDMRSSALLELFVWTFKRIFLISDYGLYPPSGSILDLICQEPDCACMCVCRCLTSGLPDMRLGQHFKGQSLLPTLWGGAILLSRGML